MKISAFGLYLPIRMIFFERAHLFIVDHIDFLKQLAIPGEPRPTPVHSPINIIALELQLPFRKVIFIEVIKLSCFVAFPDLDFAVRIIEFPDPIRLTLVFVSTV
jgi:hypothetical protein